MNNNYPTELLPDNKIGNEHFIIFLIKNNKYAINIQNVIEVINIPLINTKPITQEGIIGTIDYNGKIINVIDLCPFIGLGYADFSINNKLLVIKNFNNIFAIHTENIENIIQTENNYFQQLPYQLENYIIKEIYTEYNTPINIIDTNLLSNLLSDSLNKISSVDYNALFPSDEKSTRILMLRSKQNKVSKGFFNIQLTMVNLSQYILFTLDNNNYYLDLKHVKEFRTIKKLNITKLPYTQNFIKGIVNLKGEFLVVMDLKAFLGNNSDTDSQGNKLIVVEGENYNIAFLVDEIKSIKTIKDIQKNDIYSGNSKYIEAEFSEEGILYSILNLDRIINDDRIFINIR